MLARVNIRRLLLVGVTILGVTGGVLAGPREWQGSAQAAQSAPSSYCIEPLSGHLGCPPPWCWPPIRLSGGHLGCPPPWCRPPIKLSGGYRLCPRPVLAALPIRPGSGRAAPARPAGL
jgi:hypothetical protein